MTRSFRSRINRRKLGLMAALLLTALAVLQPEPGRAAPPSQGTSAGWLSADTTTFRVHVQSDDPAAAASFAVAHGGTLEQAFTELGILFGVDAPAERIPIFAYAAREEYDAAVLANVRPEIAQIEVIADPSRSDISLFLPSFEKLSPIQAENQLRHAVSHIATGIASQGKVPWGFDEGIAQYVERPVNEQMARTASLVQAANQRGNLPSWFDMNRPNAFVDPTLAAAQSYAAIAFLIDRYELPALRQFLVELRTASTWNEALRLAYGRDPKDVEEQWQENLPRWTSEDWRRNLVAAFDLEPAKALLAQAKYVAAKAALEPPLTLFRQIDAPEQLELVKSMIGQCDIGIQAESLMTQVQQALEAHTYDRAVNLLAQAKLQYAQLPEAQQPIEMIATYEKLAADGLQASAQLDEAGRLSQSWRNFPEARRAARAAGTTFAAIGDQAGVVEAQAILDELDKDQRRIVLLLGALAVLTLVWLALWLWARGPAELSWQ
jgi:hypothetical protein